jgi:hypothetical protein
VSPVKYGQGFYIPEDDILLSHRPENLKSYKVLVSSPHIGPQILGKIEVSDCECTVCWSRRASCGYQEPANTVSYFSYNVMPLAVLLASKRGSSEGCLHHRPLP